MEFWQQQKKKKKKDALLTVFITAHNDVLRILFVQVTIMNINSDTNIDKKNIHINQHITKYNI